MLPKLRRSSQHCHDQAQLLTIGDPSSDDGDSQQPGSQYRIADGYRDDQPTVLHHAQTTTSPSLDENDDDRDDDDDDGHDDDDSVETRRFARSGGVPPESQPSVRFHDSWLRDPLREELEETRPGKTRKRPGQQSASSSSSRSRRHRKRRGRASISEAGPSSHRQPARSGPEAANHGEGRDGGDYGSVPPLLLEEEPEWADWGGAGADQVDDYGPGPLHDGDAPRQEEEEAPALVHPQSWREDAWTESETRLADALLYETHQEQEGRNRRLDEI
ncbi:hypothetical protein MAPG_10663 [Magnaporthiopsis poae ATCC 64411]|uniref:Uncharacterized protein n=1 Tax=Magnaporthiopsis poae (strain ATCC 64411 / 73-15) TaxID=644358 RepID=A0A0C4ED70_MAGP6|nr:hypothetical protein MAPG_10663 [Magnaporthiopsis poae ATCC 64411]